MKVNKIRLHEEGFFLGKFISVVFYLPISFLLKLFSVKFIYMKWPNAIGHIVHEPSLFLRECYLNKKNYKYKILLLPKEKIANMHFVDHYLSKNFIIIKNGILCKLLFPLSVYGFCSFDPSRYFTNQNTPDPKVFREEMKSMEIQKLMNATYKIKKFKYTLSEEDKIDSDKLIKNLNLDSYKYYICIHFRDKSYRDIKECARDTFEAENYLPLIKKLISENVAVVRVGRSDVQLSDAFKIKGFFDYTSSNYVSDKNDILLFSNCKFFLGTNSGAAVLADIFDVHIGCCNFIPFAKPADYKGYYYYPKVIRNISGEIMQFKDVLKSEIANSYDLDVYKKNNLIITENSPYEIINFYYECKNRIEKNYIEDSIESELRKRYDKLRSESDFYYPGGSKISGSF